MREIKFRAWDKVNKKMYPVTYLSLTDKRLTMFALPKKGNEPWEEMGVPGNQIELMQFTGLKDKNGKEIYHNDIIEELNIFTKEKKRGIVKWFEHECRWGLDLGNDEVTTFYFKKPNSYEVIGNIYENKELVSPTLKAQ